MIFVFGSNTGGIHGAGAALAAYKQHGARWGMGYGHYGNSFAIPTKGHTGTGENKRIGDTLKLEHIKNFVRGFEAYVRTNPDMQFQVTRIGCGLAGLKDHEVAQLFIFAPLNLHFDTAWKEFFDSYTPEHQYNYWGTF